MNDSGASRRGGYGLAAAAGIQGRPQNNSRSTVIAACPCLPAVDR